MRVLGLQDPGTDVLVYHGVILGKQIDSTISQSVTTTVAHVGDHHPVTPGKRSNEGRTHLSQCGLPCGGGEDARVGELDAGLQDGRAWEPTGRRAPAWPGRIGILEHRAHVVDRHSRGHFPARVTAHSIGDHEEAKVRVNGEAVLIVLARSADVGQSEGL
jgi:hypothetical protein